MNILHIVFFLPKFFILGECLVRVTFWHSVFRVGKNVRKGVILVVKKDSDWHTYIFRISKYSELYTFNFLPKNDNWQRISSKHKIFGNLNSARKMINFNTKQNKTLFLGSKTSNLHVESKPLKTTDYTMESDILKKKEKKRWYFVLF